MKETDDYYPTIGYNGTFRVIVVDSERGIIYLSCLNSVLNAKGEEWAKVNSLLYKSCLKSAIAGNFYFNLRVIKITKVIVYMSVVPWLESIEQFDLEVQNNYLKQLCQLIGYTLPEERNGNYVSAWEDIQAKLQSVNQNYLTSVTTKQLEVNKIPVNSLKEGEIAPFFFRFLVQIPFDQTLILAPVGGAVKYPQNLEQISQLSNG